MLVMTNYAKNYASKIYQTLVALREGYGDFLELHIARSFLYKIIGCFHMTSWRPYWCPKKMKRRPCWCPKPVLWELNYFLMQTLSFVSINLIDAGHVSENTLLLKIKRKISCNQHTLDRLKLQISSVINLHFLSNKR